MPSHQDRVRRNYDRSVEDRLVNDYLALRKGNVERDRVLSAMEEALKLHPSARIRIEELGF